MYNNNNNNNNNNTSNEIPTYTIIIAITKLTVLQKCCTRFNQLLRSKKFAFW